MLAALTSPCRPQVIVSDSAANFTASLCCCFLLKGRTVTFLAHGKKKSLEWRVCFFKRLLGGDAEFPPKYFQEKPLASSRRPPLHPFHLCVLERMLHSQHFKCKPIAIKAFRLQEARRFVCKSMTISESVGVPQCDEASFLFFFFNLCAL